MDGLGEGFVLVIILCIYVPFTCMFGEDVRG